jgi:hypothetical protein
LTAAGGFRIRCQIPQQQEQGGCQQRANARERRTLALRGSSQVRAAGRNQTGRDETAVERVQVETTRSLNASGLAGMSVCTGGEDPREYPEWIPCAVPHGLDCRWGRSESGARKGPWPSPAGRGNSSDPTRLPAGRGVHASGHRDSSRKTAKRRGPGNATSPLGIREKSRDNAKRWVTTKSHSRR